MADKLTPLHLCGFDFGFYTGWDQADTMAFFFYKFESHQEIEDFFPEEGTLYVNFEEGMYQLSRDETGTVIAEGSLAKLFKSRRLKAVDKNGSTTEVAKA